MRILLALLISLSLAACGKPWNNPYPKGEEGLRILYSSFSEQPKHLDPARSYSSNEYAFIAQIYEPPLQYHFLKRPYELIPLTATEVPKPRLLDAQGSPLPEGADPATVAFSEYEIRIQPGIRYQPHPAFALKPDGTPRYLELGEKDLIGVHALKDFAEIGTRELTAADHVFQIKRLAQASTHSPIAGLMAEHIDGFEDFAKRIAAEEKRPQQKGFLDLRQFEMAGVREIDRHRFSIRLKGVYPQFVYWLAMPFFAPMPWEAVRFYSQPGMEERNISLDWYPVGTGPFLLAENNPNLRMVLDRNPNFHGETYPAEGEPDDRDQGLLADAGRPLPLIDKAVHSLEKEDIPYWNKFLQGYYDTSGITSDSFDQAVRFDTGGEAGLTGAMKRKGINLTTAVTTSIMYLGFNMKDSVVGGDTERARLLRRAISIAVDYEEYIAIFANGRGLTAQGPLPPGIFGHREGDYNPHVFEKSEGRLKRRAIAEAKGLLAKAGYPDAIDSATGKPLVLYFDVAAAGPDDKSRLSWLRKQFDKLGVQLILRTTDYNRFQEKMQKGTGQMFWWGWNADYPDPENFFFLLHGPNGKVEHGGENAANYANPEFDALFDRMKNMPNGPERQAVINQMTEILRRDAPWIWGFFPKGFSLHHAWYHNVKPNLMANNTLKYKRIDPEGRREFRIQWNEPLWWPVILTLLALAALIIPAVRLHRQRERSSAR
ncbi:MAG: peptide ABC transporter substrate-binding protein [Gammaproteobacteria bacterium RIFOXYA12_FULL_61_12]|nr:MAG: peptide ABC transporter substrate-binding protein [Gammaproteobacteria bacterium RIFOXYA12_FULL_61_12]OGT88500.1 MAG: peptide ABC transporter substrate-binding protein [Gammaproteobacteria bacterium RIFOXYD12_FULL_61_37]